MIVERNDEDFRLLVDTALSEAYRSGTIEKGYDKYLGDQRHSEKIVQGVCVALVTSLATGRLRAAFQSSPQDKTASGEDFAQMVIRWVPTF